ncbi:MAG: hypothetical protein IIB38_09720 [Candidatus Hydrogenedentes bacterium]|nr:hypothetical protein [Candidatus Hydrogenedentota bacterium]
MSIRTPIRELFGIDHPVVLGEMMGISDGNLTPAGDIVREIVEEAERGMAQMREAFAS